MGKTGKREKTLQTYYQGAAAECSATTAADTAAWCRSRWRLLGEKPWMRRGLTGCATPASPTRSPARCCDCLSAVVVWCWCLVFVGGVGVGGGGVWCLLVVVVMLVVLLLLVGLGVAVLVLLAVLLLLTLFSLSVLTSVLLFPCCCCYCCCSWHE